MRFQVHAETLAKNIQDISNIVEKRQTSPILGYFLLHVHGGELIVTATDLEIEIMVKLQLESSEDGMVTVPAKKFSDICRSIPSQDIIRCSIKDNFVHITSGSSRFTLNTLPYDDFPRLDTDNFSNEYEISLLAFKDLLDRTHFAMAIQDVRTFLNGMLLEFGENTIRAVSTDAHRLALCEKPITKVNGDDKVQTILPRKAVQELLRILDSVEESVKIKFNENHFQVLLPNIQFISKLVDGHYPDYERVLPVGGKFKLLADREQLKQSLIRTAILASEKYKGVLLRLEPDVIHIIVNNTEHETAEVELPVDYQGDSFEVGFNISYLLDVVNSIKEDQVEFQFIDSASSCMMMEQGNSECRYVVMPMRV